ncbi:MULTISPECIES: DUF4190 domain-containing protein [unclassified Streptomyces]|uniref:DUF4190 domain-containing protein n=1 Tax=unclassified Streptomyces TaxID=2593676 RepID=UPI0036434AEF
MSDKSEQPPGGYEPGDPWAPPEQRIPLDKPAPLPPPPISPDLPGQQQSAGAAQHPQHPQPPQPSAGSIHNQPTIMDTPAGGSGFGAVPPPPTAPGGPAQPAPGPYGYPGASPGQHPAAPYGAGAGPGQAPGYGYPGYPAAQPYPGMPGYGQPGWQPPANGMGVAAMVLGILSVCLFCLYGIGGIVLGVLALIFGIVGRKRVRRGQATNEGQARAGVILGSIGIALGVIFLGFIIWGITQAINEERNNDYDSTYDDYSTSLVVDVTR